LYFQNFISGIDTPDVDYNGLDISLKYNLDDDNHRSFVNFWLLEGDCATEVTTDESIEPMGSDMTLLFGDVSTQVDLRLTISPEAIGHSNIYKIHSEDEAEIEFCVRLFLFNKSPMDGEALDGILHETVITIGIGGISSKAFINSVSTHPVDLLNERDHSQVSRDLVLSSPYAISIPEMFYCDSAEVILRYIISDAMTNQMISYGMYTGKNCDNDITDNTYFTPTLVYDDVPTGDGTGIRQIAYVLSPDPETIDNSPIFSFSADGQTANMQFCTRIKLFTADGKFKKCLLGVASSTSLSISFRFFLVLKRVVSCKLQRHRIPTQHWSC
jgi:hypothetical protein